MCSEFVSERIISGSSESYIECARLKLRRRLEMGTKEVLSPNWALDPSSLGPKLPLAYAEPRLTVSLKTQT